MPDSPQRREIVADAASVEYTAGDEFEIEVVVRGPERTVPTSNGPRTERDTYASLEVPIDGTTAWMIYRRAIEAACSPQVVMRPPAEWLEERGVH